MEMIGVASLLRMMPMGYEEACYSTKAIVRNRGIKDPNDLMMLALFHLLTGCSLVEVSEISKLAKLGDISDVAFMKRFNNCTEWFKWVLTAIQEKNQQVTNYVLPERLQKYRILAVDASDVTEKGRSGRIYRLHFRLCGQSPLWDQTGWLIITGLSFSSPSKYSSSSYLQGEKSALPITDSTSRATISLPFNHANMLFSDFLGNSP